MDTSPVDPVKAQTLTPVPGPFAESIALEAQMRFIWIERRH